MQMRGHVFHAMQQNSGRHVQKPKNALPGSALPMEASRPEGFANSAPCRLQLWSLEGRQLATLQGAALSTTANTVFVSDQQDLLFVYCPPSSSTTLTTGSTAAVGSTAADVGSIPARQGGTSVAPEQQQDDGRAGRSATKPVPHQGCVHVYDLLTGRQVATVQHHIELGGQAPPAWQRSSSARSSRDVPATSAAAASLRQVTALFYHQASHRLYTGGADGRVQAWGL
jgi:hypothetical protein